MNTRQWTVEELKAAGWSWRIDIDGTVAAQADDKADGRFVQVVWVDPMGRLASSHGCVPPEAIALAVILASRGMDSLGTMADALDGLRRVSLQCGEDSPSDSEDAAVFSVEASAYAVGSAMLRRGTVQP